MMFTGPYRIPKVGFSAETVFTNTCGKAPFRGPVGDRDHRPGADDGRRRPRARAGPPRVPPPQRHPPVGSAVHHPERDGLRRRHPEETMEQAVGMLDCEAFRRRAGERPAPRAGCSASASACASSRQPSAFGAWATEAATVRIDVSGQVEVLLGSGSHGHSLETTIPQVVADHLGVRIEDVRSSGRHGRHPVRARHRREPQRGDRRRRRPVSSRHPARQGRHHRRSSARGGAPRTSRCADSIVSVRGTPPRSVTFAELAGTAYLNPDALPPGIEAGPRGDHPLPAARPVHVVQRLPRLHVRGRRGDRGSHAAAVSSSARTAAS